MKSFYLCAALWLLGVQIMAQSGTAPAKFETQPWGHYKKLASISAQPRMNLSAIDSLHFELAKGETTDIHCPPSKETTGQISGPNAAARERAPESRCDPAACQPAEVIGNGRKRSAFYLSGKENYSIQAPPPNSSLQTRAELDYLLQLQTQRTEEDIRSSLYYAGVYYRTSAAPADKDYRKLRRNLFHIGRSIGTWFNADSLPITANLVANVWRDAEYVIWKYKNYFIRIRPYKLDPALQNLEETNWAAYPSGHATNSYMNAYLFSALLPEFESFFLKDAYDMAHSREIIGVHYPSDSESGRILAKEILTHLMKNAAFKKDFQEAREEINLVRKTKGY